jgi:hypothetical protein
MTFFRLIILIIGIYLAYRFVFDFLIPVYRTSKKMHRQFRNMQDSMNEQMNQTYNTNATPPPQQPQPGKVDKKDYIDFEEIK